MNENKTKTRQQTQNSETKNRKRQNLFVKKVGKKLYTGDKINLLQKVGKSEIKKLRVKLLLILVFNLLRRILFNTYFNLQPFRANEISLESS